MSPPPKQERLDDATLQGSLQGSLHFFQAQRQPYPPSTPMSDLVANANTSALDAARSSAARRKAGPESALGDLQALPEVRPIPWLDGKELPPEKSIDSPRTQTRGAFLLSTRGRINSPPCTHCATGSGRFSACISLDPWFHGACSTCQMATRGHTCSLRTEVSGSPSRAKTQQSVFKVSKSKEGSSDGGAKPMNAMKRKIETPTPPPPQGGIPGPGRAIAPKAPSPPLSYGSTQSMQSKPPFPNSVGYGGYGSINTYNMRIESNGVDGGHGRPIAPMTHHQMQMGVQNGFDGRDSMSPSNQLLQPTPLMQDMLTSNKRTHMSTTPMEMDQHDTSLIDALPRKKQKQIFSIIGGIQSGIRSVRVQADYLEKQLDMLQQALGIDADDDSQREV